MFGLSQIHLVIIGGLLAVVLAGGAILYVYGEGKDAGSAAVTSAVQTETIKAGAAARIQKERADAETRSVPYGERVDGLR